MLHHELDGRLLQLGRAVQVGQDQALQAGVHCQGVTQHLGQSDSQTVRQTDSPGSQTIKSQTVRQSRQSDSQTVRQSGSPGSHTAPGTGRQ